MQGQTQVLNIPKLIEGIKCVQSKLQGLENSQDNQDQCCFMLGLTGSGKSSLICYLGGMELKCTKKNVNFLLSHQNPDYPKIGNTVKSCTQVPSLYKFHGQICYYDPPGFLDTKGVYQEILNAYCNSNMFKIGSKAKIVIVVQISTLKSGRGGSFVDVAKRLRELFNNDFRQIVYCCLLVVSKLNQDVQSIEDIKELIEQILDNNAQLEIEGALLLRMLITENRIVAFPIPKQVNAQKISYIQQQISKLPTFSIAVQPNISISSEAKNCLQQVARHCEKIKCELAHQIGKEISCTFNKVPRNKENLAQSLQNLKLSGEMLVKKEIESGIPEKVSQFQQRLQIKDSYIDGLREWMSQSLFCLTIYPQMKVSTKISEILLTYITQTVRQLEGMLNQIASQEQIDKMNKNHQEQMTRREIQFQKQCKSIQQTVRKNQQALIEKATKANDAALTALNAKLDEEIRKKTSQNKEIEELKNKIKTIENRPPPQPVKPEVKVEYTVEYRWACQIM